MMTRWLGTKAAALSGFFAVTLLTASACANGIAVDRQPDVVFVPTPQATVDKMLELAGVGPNDVVYDLGSGDGRIVITAARDFGVRKAIGIDIDPALVQRANRNARDAGVNDRVQIVEGNFFEFDFSEATVLTLYLLPSLNVRLRPTILELRPGTRVVSHAFDMREWKEDDYARIEDMDIYLWIVPARVEGAWQSKHGGDVYQVSLTQNFQEVSGKLNAFGRGTPVKAARLRGTEISFEADTRRGGRTTSVTFDGTVSGDTMEGTLRVDGEAEKAVFRRVN